MPGGSALPHLLAWVAAARSAFGLYGPHVSVALPLLHAAHLLRDLERKTFHEVSLAKLPRMCVPDPAAHSRRYASGSLQLFSRLVELSLRIVDVLCRASGWVSRANRMRHAVHVRAANRPSFNLVEACLRFFQILRSLPRMPEFVLILLGQTFYRYPLLALFIAL